MVYDQLIVSGSVAYDEIMDFPSYFVKYLNPKMLHQINVSFVVDRLERQLGGTATNIVYGARLLTSKKISILSSIGKDGLAFKSFFKKHKINLDFLIQDKKSFSATGKVITDKGDNQIWGYYHGALAKAAEINLKDNFNDKCFMILSATAPRAFLSHLDQLIDNKIPYMFDPGMTLTWISPEKLKLGIKFCRFLIGNDYEIASIKKVTHWSIQEICSQGIEVITTLGNKGVRYESKRLTIDVPGYKISNPVDPTGAGDAFRGGYLAAFLEGKNMKDCLIWGNALASFSVEKYGTVNYKFTDKRFCDRVNKIKSLM